MCGIIGIAIRDFKETDRTQVRDLFLQSQIRGKHATGVSYVKGDQVHTIKEPVPAEKFLENKNIEDWINEDGNLYCIGHVRYCTSGFEFNQPIASYELSVVHNGVISQEAPESWYERYALHAVNTNDSELVLRCLEDERHPLEHFPDASMAVCTIRNNKTITAFRNHARPLYKSIHERGIIFTSTGDIAKRSLLSKTKKCDMFHEYIVENFSTKAVEYSATSGDLQ